MLNMAAKTKPDTKVSFNPLEGQFDFITGNNFSYKSVPSNKKIKVLENMQMIVHEEFQIEPGGELIVDGDLVLEP